MDAENDEEAAMRALMGFGGFDTTKVRSIRSLSHSVYVSYLSVGQACSWK